MGTTTTTKQTTKSDYQNVLGLMKEMGSKNGFDPMPPDQHAWTMREGEPPLYRIWGWMCAHTIHWGHRSPFAISKEGDELHLENIAADLKMDEANVRRYWREGLAIGLWRGGTRAEGTRRLYLNGKLTPQKEVETAPEKDCTDNSERRINILPPSVRKQITNWEVERQNALADEIAREIELEKTTFSAAQAAIRSISGQRKDTVYTRHGVKFDRQEHTKQSETPEDADARRARIQPLLPALEIFVHTISADVQTPETTLYTGSRDSVQATSANPYLIEKRLPEKPEPGSSSSNLNASHGREKDQGFDGQKSLKQLPMPTSPERANGHAENGKRLNQKPRQTQAAAEPEEAMRLAKILDVDLDAGHKILSGCRAADPRITLKEIELLSYLKIRQVREQVKRGEVNIPGYLMSALPKAALGGQRETVRRQAAKELEQALEYARAVAEDDMADANDRARALADIPMLEAELELLCEVHARGAAS